MEAADFRRLVLLTQTDVAEFLPGPKMVAGLPVGADEDFCLKGVAQFPPPQFEGSGGGELVVVEVRVDEQGLHRSKVPDGHDDTAPTLQPLRGIRVALSSRHHAMAGAHPTVVGPYVIVRLLGHGRLGDLYLAVDAMLDRQVAVRIRPVLSAENGGRFARDVRRRATLQHAAIAPIYMVGEHEGRLYFARSFVAGWTFEEIVSAKNPISVVRRLDFMATVCEALAYAYGVGYASLPLRSAEVVVSAQGAPTLLDIGLPTTIEGTTSRPRAQCYRSPEELRGADPDQRSDIFVAGAVPSTKGGKPMSSSIAVPSWPTTISAGRNARLV